MRPHDKIVLTASRCTALNPGLREQRDGVVDLLRGHRRGPAEALAAGLGRGDAAEVIELLDVTPTTTLMIRVRSTFDPWSHVR